MTKSTQLLPDIISVAEQIARNNLIDFSILINQKYKPNWHHEVIADELTKIEKDGDKHFKILLLLVPPRHGKSQLASIYFPAWYLGRNPEKEIITASYSAELALDFGGKTRDLINDGIYQNIFNVKLRLDEQKNMSDDKNKQFTPKGEDVIRQEVAKEFTDLGYDSDLEENKPIIDQMVKKVLNIENERIEHQKKLSKAIEQKQAWREKATKILQEDDDSDDNGQQKPTGDNNQNAKSDDKINMLEQQINELKTLQHRQNYQHLSDEEYSIVKALASSNGKTFEDTMQNNPIVKQYLEKSEAERRIANATNNPSSRTFANQQKSEEDKIADELDKNLPPGFSSKKEN